MDIFEYSRRLMTGVFVAFSLNISETKDAIKNLTIKRYYIVTIKALIDKTK